MNLLSHRELPDFIVRQLGLPLPGAGAQSAFAPELSYGRHHLPPPQDARRAAVLLLLYRHAGSWRLPLTLRSDTMATHAGQISLPGGEIETGETVEQAAMRELAEELQVGTDDVKLLGLLSEIYVFASNFAVTPCVAVSPSRPAFLPNRAEVANLLEPTLVELLDPHRRGEHQIERRGIHFRAPHIEYQGHRIWGATSMILAEFLALVDGAGTRDEAGSRDEAGTREQRPGIRNEL